MYYHQANFVAGSTVIGGAAPELHRLGPAWPELRNRLSQLRLILVERPRHEPHHGRILSCRIEKPVPRAGVGLLARECLEHQPRRNVAGSSVARRRAAGCRKADPIFRGNADLATLAP
jgi:hypothetical protein